MKKFEPYHKSRDKTERLYYIDGGWLLDRWCFGKRACMFVMRPIDAGEWLRCNNYEREDIPECVRGYYDLTPFEKRILELSQSI